MSTEIKAAVLVATATIAAALMTIYATEIKHMGSMRRLAGVGATLAGLLLVVVGLRLALAQGIQIDFTKVPRSGAGADSRGDISGRVTGVSDATIYRIVLYAHTDVWYVQPLESAPLTMIAKDGQWSNWTHLGHRYGALVVRPSYKPGTRLQALPSEGGDVVAKAETAGAGD